MSITKRKFTVFISAFLLLAAVFGVCVSAALIQYDSSVPGSGGNVLLSSGDVIEKYLGENISEDEREFFSYLESSNALETIEISYNEIINTSKVRVDYASGGITLSALEYEYVGAGGKAFRWIPKTASYAGKAVTLTKQAEEYVGYIECDEPENLADVVFTYCAAISIAAEDINEVINLYRNVAEYSYDKFEYDAYVVEKKLYDEAKAKYDKYLADVEEYERLLYEYENYESVTLPKYYSNIQKYQKYEVDKKEYDAKTAEYNNYLAKTEKIKKQLDAVKLIDVPMAQKRTIYKAITGGTVDQALENVAAIAAVGGIDKDAVRLAEEATERVRSLMKGFKACKKDSEKYAYYTANYTNFCESFLLLTQTLEVLYTPAVRGYSKANGKDEKYMILVAQLALISNALIDGELRDYNGDIAYNSSWEFYGKTIKQILENKTYFVDDNTAAPIDVPPEVKKPAELVEVKKPVFPVRPEKPIVPYTVSNPGAAPAKVNNPDKSLKQAALPEVYRSLDKDYISRLRGLSESELPAERDTLSDSAEIYLYTSVKKKYGAESVNVTFLGLDGVQTTLTVDKGSAVVCEASVPFSYVDQMGDKFVLIGWRNEESVLPQAYGEMVDLESGFEADTVLAPVYEHYYNISWEINGELYSKSVSVNDNAVCPITPEKADDGDWCYVFSGWVDESGMNVGTQIGNPTRDAKYTASFEKTPIVPLSSQNAANITYGENTVICDAERFYSSSPIDISKIVERAAEKQSALSVKLWRGTLEFTFSDVLALYNAGIKTVSVVYSGSANCDNYFVELCDSNGDKIDRRVKLTSATQSDNTNRYKLFFGNEEKTYVNYTLDQSKKKVTFEAQSGVQYVFRAEYVISYAPNDLVDFVISNTSPIRNEWIEYQVIPKAGVEILEILIEDDTGKTVDVWSDDNGEKGRFRVFSNDVNLSVYARYKSYTVIFRANGKNVFQSVIVHGGEVSAPKAPAMGDDGVYSYKFVGWDKEITPATSDIVYEAVYERTPLPQNNDANGLKLSPKIKKLLCIALIVLMFFVAIISTLTILIVRKIKKKKVKKFGFDNYEQYILSEKIKRCAFKIVALNEKIDAQDEKIEKYNEKLTKVVKKHEKYASKLEKSFLKKREKELEATEKNEPEIQGSVDDGVKIEPEDASDFEETTLGVCENAEDGGATEPEDDSCDVISGVDGEDAL